MFVLSFIVFLLVRCELKLFFFLQGRLTLDSDVGRWTSKAIALQVVDLLLHFGVPDLAGFLLGEAVQAGELVDRCTPYKGCLTFFNSFVV